MEINLATINGTEAANTLNGTAYADTIKGLGGDDKIYAKAGNDSVWGGLGHDSIYGDAGDDNIYGNEGDDVILGGLGNDNLYGDAGTDTLRGEGGNDILKGGAGKAFLYGGDGNDAVFYDPTTSNIKAVGAYLSPSLLKGEAGTDTLNLYNNAKVTVGGVEKAATTHVHMDQGGVFRINFGEKDFDLDSLKVNVGTASGFDVMKFFGNGGVHFSNGDEMTWLDSNVVGTSVADEFSDGYVSDTFNGGAGNDTFRLDFGGNDKIISEANDADVLYFNSGYRGGEHDTFSGFNGAGQAAGDKIYFDDGELTNPAQQVKVVNGNTVFTTDTGDTLTVLGATGLIQGVDWFV